jgi:uncharacterized membrane protein
MDIYQSIEKYIEDAIDNSQYPTALKHVMLVFAMIGIYMWLKVYAMVSGFKFDPFNILMLLVYVVLGMFFVYLGLMPLYKGSNKELVDLKQKALQMDEQAEKIKDLQKLLNDLEVQLAGLSTSNKMPINPVSKK